jgi:hypothetical protein
MTVLQECLHAIAKYQKDTGDLPDAVQIGFTEYFALEAELRIKGIVGNWKVVGVPIHMNVLARGVLALGPLFPNQVTFSIDNRISWRNLPGASEMRLTPVPKCECGAHKVGSSRHSSWCDLK